MVSFYAFSLSNYQIHKLMNLVNRPSFSLPYFVNSIPRQMTFVIICSLVNSKTSISNLYLLLLLFIHFHATLIHPIIWSTIHHLLTRFHQLFWLCNYLLCIADYSLNLVKVSFLSSTCSHIEFPIHQWPKKNFNIFSKRFTTSLT